MPTSLSRRGRIQCLLREYASLKIGKESLLALIDEAQTPENAYHSNASASVG